MRKVMMLCVVLSSLGSPGALAHDAELAKASEASMYSLGFHMGSMFAAARGAADVSPEIGLFGDIGNYITKSVAIGGYADFEAAFNKGSTLLTSFGPEVKVGHEKTFSAGAGVSVLSVNTATWSDSTLLPSVLLRGSVPYGPVRVHFGVTAAIGYFVVVSTSAGIAFAL